MTKEELIQLKENNRRLLKEDIQRKSAVLRAYPSFIALTEDSRCNLRCIMCAQRLWDSTRTAQGLVLEEKYLIKFAEQVFPTASILQLNVSGEPLMSRLLDLELDLAERYGLRIEMYTNGTLLSAKTERFEKVVRNASAVVFSIDSPHKETYEAIRQGADFSQVVENMRLFQNYRCRLPPEQRPTFTITMVLMKRNLYEVPEMVYFAKKIGADYIYINPLAVILESMKEESLEHRQEESMLILSQALRLSRRLNIKIAMPSPHNSALLKRHDSQAKNSHLPAGSAQPPKRCYFLWERTYLHADGNIIACCEPSHTIVGSIKTEDFHQIWNNDAYQSMRRTFLGGPPHPLCGVCATKGFFHNLAAEC